MPRAADEYRVRRRQLGKDRRRRAVDRLQIAHAERLRIGQDQVIISRLLFDGVDHARLRQLGRFDGDRTAARADVPDYARRLNVEFRQRDRSHFRLRDESAFGPALGEHIVGVAEAAKAGGAALLVWAARLAFQNHYVQRGELHLLDVGQLALRDALVRPPQVFTDINSEIIEAARQ